MTKSNDEKLFELIMRAPHAVRRSLMNGMEEGGAEPCRHHHGKGFGAGIDCSPESGEPHGYGRCHGRGHGHGPHHAFARDRMLRLIGEYESGVRQKTLVELQHINPSSVSELITRLEEDGYVRRTVDPEDKRATRISLTELGTARAAELADERRDRFTKAFEKLGEDEKDQLVRLLEKLLG